MQPYTPCDFKQTSMFRLGSPGEDDGETISEKATVWNWRGKAGEYLVCSDLILQGHNAYLVDSVLPYDVVIDPGDGSLIRVQVKTRFGMDASKNKSGTRLSYIFPVNQCYGREHILKRYPRDSFDVLALVALDIRKTAYVRIEQFGDQEYWPRSITFSGPEHLSEYSALVL